MSDKHAEEIKSRESESQRAIWDRLDRTGQIVSDLAANQAAIEANVNSLADSCRIGFDHVNENIGQLAQAQAENARVQAERDGKPFPVWNVLGAVILILSAQGALMVSYVRLSAIPIALEAEQHHADLQQVRYVLADRGEIIGEQVAHIETNQSRIAENRDDIDAAMKKVTDDGERIAFLEGRVQQVERWLGQVDDKGSRRWVSDGETEP